MTKKTNSLRLVSYNGVLMLFIVLYCAVFYYILQCAVISSVYVKEEYDLLIGWKVFVISISIEVSI